MKIQTGLGDNADNKQTHWKVLPVHGKDNWQVGRVKVTRSEAYKILATTSRNGKAIGYVAIDDFNFTKFSSTN